MVSNSQRLDYKGSSWRKTRKSVVLPWKKDIEKYRRCQPKAPPLEPTCKHANTKLQCSTLSEDEVKAFYKKFYYTRDRDVQDAFILKHCEGRSPRIKRTAGVRKRRRNVSALYFVSTRERRVRVCRSAFTGILRVKDYRINNVLKMFRKEKEEDGDLIRVSTYVSQYPKETNKTKKKVTFASKSHFKHLGTETSFFLPAHSPITEESYFSNNDDLFNTAKHFSIRDLLDLSNISVSSDQNNNSNHTPQSIETALPKEPKPVNLNKNELKKHIDNIYSLDISDEKEQSIIVEKTRKQRKLKNRTKTVKEKYKNNEDIPSGKESIAQDNINTIVGSECENLEEVPHLKGKESRNTVKFSEKPDSTIPAAKQQIDVHNEIEKETMGHDDDPSKENERDLNCTKEQKLSACELNKNSHSKSRDISVDNEKNEEIERYLQYKENRPFILRMEGLSEMQKSFNTPVDNLPRRGRLNSNLNYLTSKKTNKEMCKENPKRLTAPVKNNLKDKHENFGEQDAINNRVNNNFSDVKIKKFNTATNRAKKSNGSRLEKKLLEKNEENNNITENVCLPSRNVIHSGNKRNQLKPSSEEDPPLDDTMLNISKGENVQKTVEKETGSLKIKECVKTKTEKNTSSLQALSIPHCLGLSGNGSEQGLSNQSYNSVMEQGCHKLPTKHSDKIRRNQGAKNMNYECSTKEGSVECIESFEETDNTEPSDISDLRKLKRNVNGRLSSPLRDNATLVQNPPDKNDSVSQNCPNKNDTTVREDAIRKDSKASKHKGRNSSPLRDKMSLSCPNQKDMIDCPNRGENKSEGRKQEDRKSAALREKTCLFEYPEDQNDPLPAQDIPNNQNNDGKNLKSSKHNGRNSSPLREKVSLIEGSANQNDSTPAQNFPNKKDKMDSENRIDLGPIDSKKELKKCSPVSDVVNVFDKPTDGSTLDQNTSSKKEIAEIERLAEEKTTDTEHKEEGSDDEKDNLNRTFTLAHTSPGQTAELNVKLFENSNEPKLYRLRKFNWSSPKSKKVRDIIEKISRPPKYTPFAENDDENKSNTDSNDDGTVFKCPIGISQQSNKTTKPDAINIYTTRELGCKESRLLEEKRRNMASRRLKAYCPSDDKENMPYHNEYTQDENNCPSIKTTNELEVLPKKRVIRSRLGRRNLVKNETNEENINAVSKSRVPLQVLQM